MKRAQLERMPGKITSYNKVKLRRSDVLNKQPVVKRQ